MKKIYKNLVITAALLTGHATVAQVATYVFLQQPSTYVAITGGTVFGTPTSDDDYFANGASPATNLATGPGISIGFTFTFNSIPFDVFGIQNNGWISFGQSTLAPNPVNLNVSNAYTGISGTSTSPAALQHRIAGLSRDIQGNGGSLRAETIGTSPNRVCVIQWSNYKIFGGTDNFSFQIRLNETTNIIDVVYGPWVTVTSTTGGEVGLRGALNTDYNNRNVVAPNVWATSIAGTINTSICNWNTTGLFPNLGQKYEWLPPAPCTIPPAANAVASSTNVCPGANVLLSLSTTYTNTGYTYQWQSSSTGTAGIFSNMAGTTPAINSGTLALGTAFRAIITCTNGPTSVTSTPIQVNVGAPDMTSAVAALTLICPNGTASLSLGASYVGLGVNYQWQTSTVSIVGTWTNASGVTPATSGTLATLTAPGLTTTTYYQAILSCSALASFSTITNAVAVNIAGVTLNTIPYYEGFETISITNQLPNCSWMASNLPTICQTNTTVLANNRIPHAGAKYASFKSGTSAGGDYFYTNGLQLSAGVTYSGAVWYTTDGAVGWTNLSLLVGPNQSAVGLSAIASVTGAVSGTFYQLLSGTFTVQTSGIYYVAIKCIGNATPQYLSFDDISVTIPCSINPPNLVVTANSSTICSGHPLTLVASGADSYVWSTGETGTLSATNPVNLGLNTYTVMGTSLLTGCTNASVVSFWVIPSPVVLIVSSPPAVCAGQPVSLSALGNANSFVWSNNANTAVITVTTNATTTYSVIGTGTNGCTTNASQSVGVMPLPTITVVSGVPGDICMGDQVNLTASGASNYMWISNTSPNVLVGNPVSVVLTSPTAFTVTGNGSNGCVGKNVLNQNVVTCVGLANYALENRTMVYPNPTNGEITVEFKTEETKTIEVLDLTGRVILINSGTDKKMNVSLSDLANGIYYIKIKSNGSFSVTKVVKE